MTALLSQTGLVTSNGNHEGFLSKNKKHESFVVMVNYPAHKLTLHSTFDGAVWLLFWKEKIVEFLDFVECVGCNKIDFDLHKRNFFLSMMHCVIALFCSSTAT